jgi:hypothetical protein
MDQGSAGSAVAVEQAQQEAMHREGGGEKKAQDNGQGDYNEDFKEQLEVLEQDNERQSCFDEAQAN